jgi:hypothetical protein
VGARMGRVCNRPAADSGVAGMQQSDALLQRLTAVLDGQGAKPSDGGAAHGNHGRLVAGPLRRHRRLHYLHSATATNIMTRFEQRS